MRLNKYISASGACSRREADRFIEEGRVLINGRRAKVGDPVPRNGKVTVNGQLIDGPTVEQSVIIALNKPVGVVSTTEASEKDNIVRFVGHPTRIFPIGRLDKDSEGLILLTSDGDLVNKVLRAGNEHQKEYVVTVDRPVTPEFIKGMSEGVPILGTRTKKCVVDRVSDRVFRIVLVQGLNRQIRRMCEHFGFRVERLRRTRIMHLALDRLPTGDWRDLTDAERDELMRRIKHSSGEAKPRRTASKKRKSATSSAKKNSDKPSAKTGGGKKRQGKAKDQRPPRKPSGKGSTHKRGRNTTAGPKKQRRK